MTATPAPPIDGAALLDQLHAVLTRYVIFPSPEAADAVTLWIAATHAQAAWAHAPRLVIRAPRHGGRHLPQPADHCQRLTGSRVPGHRLGPATDPACR